MVCGVWDRTNDRFLTADTDGYIWQIEDENTVLDGSTAISWEVRAKEYNYLKRFFPRAARYDVAPVNGATVYGRLYLDGTLKQSHTITSRSNKKRLVTTCNGERLQPGLDGTGPVKIYAMGVE